MATRESISTTPRDRVETMPGDEARSLTGDGRWRTHIPKFPFFGISREAQKRTGTAKSLLRFNFLAEWTGLEPATPGVTGRYSNQLNYHSNAMRPAGHRANLGVP